METSRSQFKIGGVPLNPDRIHAGFLNKMSRAAKETVVEGGKQEALQTFEQLEKEGEIPKNSLKTIDEFTSGVRDEYFQDRDRFWARWNANGRNFQDPELKEIEGQMGVSGAYLIKNHKLMTELREASALNAVQALAGGSFGPTGVIAGYAAYANAKDWTGAAERRTEALLETFNNLRSGESKMTTEGNRVEQVHRAELWKSMNGLLDEAIAKGQAGEPVPLTFQYYELTSPELIGQMADAAQAGSKIRMNIDAGRLSFPARDPETNQNYFEVDDIPHKMRTALQFSQIENADVGVSIFPAHRELGNPTHLMHRKVLRVGDKVLISGMNANRGSGGNIDAGYIVEGPAARDLTENVARDLKASQGAVSEDIWGERHLQKFRDDDLRVGTRGITALLDALSGPEPAGTPLPTVNDRKDLEALAAKAEVELESLFDIPKEQYGETLDRVIAGETKVSLSAQGKERLLGLMEKTIAVTQGEKNQKALQDVSLPSGEKVGSTRVDIADQPSEREALVLNAISEADEFLYLPGFVVTRAVAAAIVAKRDQAVAEGKELDIRVVADSGVYPHGGTPNSWGVDYLEDHNVPVRWSKLTRTGSHDRKIHAKQLITDKGEVVGSTNFSTKGMKDNWETSAYVHFDPKNEDSAELRETTKSQFEQLWDNETYDLSAKDLAAYRNRFAPATGKEWVIEQDRNRNTKQIITMLEKYEIETASMMKKELEVPAIKERYEALMAQGHNETNAILQAVEGEHGRENFLKMHHELESHQELMQLRDQVHKWKERFGASE